MRELHPLMLGGTLFSPASHPNLEKILQREKLPQLQSIVIDFEDALQKQSQQKALENLQNILENFIQNELIVFIRPATVSMLKELLNLNGIEKIDGFVLPKFSLTNAKEYLALLSKDFYIMPSIEKEELFDREQLKQLRELLEPYKKQILLIRIGCEDMFSLLGLKRQKNESVFDRGISGSIMYDVIKTFKPYGYAISGCVYVHFRDTKGFKEDIQTDFLQGLISKTIIHPNQIEPLQELYRVTKEEVDFAQKLLQSKEVVFDHDGMMAEKYTQSNYAKEVLLRAKIYGFKTLEEE